ncbi:hypothetical protein U1839_10260 [Sphingomonas sp. RT2P30]|uniref:hypothetical protein n=1 Tax=Parasphingomonas halimpatiens TaxID=3096162 RepID=UPI002FC650D8
MNVRAGAQNDGALFELDDLRQPQACLHGEVEQHVIAATDPAAPVARGQDRVDLASGEEMHLALVVELAGDREHALDLPGIGGLLECGVTEECSDRGEAYLPQLALE